MTVNIGQIFNIKLPPVEGNTGLNDATEHGAEEQASSGGERSMAEPKQAASSTDCEESTDSPYDELLRRVFSNRMRALAEGAILLDDEIRATLGSLPTEDNQAIANLVDKLQKRLARPPTTSLPDTSERTGS